MHLWPTRHRRRVRRCQRQTRQMLARKSFTIARGQVATSKPARCGTRLSRTCLQEGSHQRHGTGHHVQRLGSSGLGEHWTPKQGSALGRTKNWTYRYKGFGTYSPKRRQGRSLPTERTTSSQRPSVIRSTQDEHGARQAPFRGSMDFPTQAVTKAGKGRGKRSSA